MRRPRWRSRALAAGVVAAALVGLAGCGAGPAGPPTLNWYINPDDGGQAEIAARCTTAAAGKYRIAVSQLPRQSAEQRQQLVRRLAANDTSIDIMSLDPPYIPEFAEAGFLAPVPDDVAQRTTTGVVNSAIEGASWRGRLVTVPMWANTQLLWYRKSMVAGTGLDMSKPVTWDQVIAAAQSKNKQVAAQGIRAESLTVWLNALVESGGGQIVTNPSPDDPKGVQLGLDSPAATKAAEIMKATAPVAGPGFSTASEDENSEAFQGGDAMFSPIWPFIWGKVKSAVEDGSVPASVPADYGWALYPRTDASQPSKPPYGGINLGVGAFSANPELAYEATECITSTENQAYYFVSNGNPAAKEAVYKDPEVLEEFPMAPVIEQSLQQAAPRPQTAYYSEVSESIQRIYHPTGGIDPATVGPAAAALIKAVLAKEKLL
ncbi:carbohydrate ABC transporter substrate-binding protein (CUT1 family) [Pseudonocardia sediminis]|uniref:Carbohydrate ABC transporter substrate-binding protein (CUT1 family) n=1 Tax=Pseudonocardia sediminis TaxID=1397368 RepID=A0A4Q7UWB3_PSEST|nr:extracellular solute-binding protein [Pseudonocardia sediminis]RZT86126.1 carbohydrate ABC transporter substrate-binding protein (CUT1 family) [Pseudonocardia sediminis]